MVATVKIWSSERWRCLGFNTIVGDWVLCRYNWGRILLVVLVFNWAAKVYDRTRAEPEKVGNRKKKLRLVSFWISTTFMRDVGSSVLDFWECILQLSTMCVQARMFVGMAMQDPAPDFRGTGEGDRTIGRRGRRRLEGGGERVVIRV